MLAISGFLRLGGVMDLVSKPVMTGFLFGLGMFVALSQLPRIFRVPAGSGNFFPRLWDLLTDLDQTQGWTLAVGLASIALLVVLARAAPKLPGTLVVLVLAIVLSALLDLKSRGVDVVGDLPRAVPHVAWPGAGWRDVLHLLAPAFGIMIVSAEAVGVARTLAGQEGYRVSANRDLIAMGGSNLAAGFTQGFVQSGGASQTMASERAGGKSQLASLVAAGIILITGAFLTFLFEDLPEATLAAIVVVAISGFFRVDELRRFARIRTSAIVFALLALVGVLVAGVLPGLIIAAGLSFILLIQRLSRPPVGRLARDPASGAWGNAERHPDWVSTPEVLVVRADGPLFYANAVHVKEHVIDFASAADPKPRTLILDLAGNHDLDVETLDTLGELEDALAADSIELRLGGVPASALPLLQRSGLVSRLRVEPTLDAAVPS